MVGSINIPQDVADIVEIQVTKKNEALFRFLTDVATKMSELEERLEKIENGN